LLNSVRKFLKIFFVYLLRIKNQGIMKKIFLVFFIGILVSCSNDTIGDKIFPQTSSVQIRIQNASPYKFENVIVNTYNKEISYENLNSNQKSVFKTFDVAYRYAFVQLQINGKTYTYQPVDFVGETVLENGNYTYKITASSPSDQYQKLDLELIKN
jgi:hypothetical protein